MAKHKRESGRKRTRVKACVTAVESGESFTAFTRDISKKGLFIETRVVLPPGSALQIELQYPDRTLELKGVVVRAERVPVQLQAALKAGMGVLLEQTNATSEASGTGRTPRLPLGSDVVVFFGSERHRLTLHDLSTTGAAVVSPETLPEMGFVRLHFKLPPATDIIEVEGMPVGTRELDGQTLIAINFIEPPTTFVERIEALIGERDDHI